MQPEVVGNSYDTSQFVSRDSWSEDCLIPCKQMLASKHNSLRNIQLCDFLSQLDEDEYAKLQRESTKFIAKYREKTDVKKIALPVAMTTPMLIFGCIFGGAIGSVGGPLGVIAGIAGMGTMMGGMAAGISSLFDYVLLRDDWKRVAEQYTLKRKIRLANKISMIEREKENYNVNDDEYRQLTNAKNAFETVKNQWDRRVSVRVS